MNRRTLLGGLFAAATVPALASCSSGITSLDGGGSSGGGGGSSEGGVTIGTANFTENQVLGHLYAAALDAAGVKNTVRPNLGTREILIPALKGGDIDLLPEYQGALLHYLDAKATATEEGEMQNALAMALPRGLQILPYGRAEDSDAFAVTRETAREYGLKSLADLAKHNGKLVIGAAPEVKKRAVGSVGLKDVYGVEFKEFKSLDSSGPLVKGALKKGDVDVANLFTTDTDIVAEGWVVLTDPKNLIPGQHVVPLIADRKADSTVRKALARLGGLLTTKDLTELNRLVDKDRKDPEDVAHDWAAKHGIRK
ncbi:MULTISPECIES: ABC transporter substrate-binding protein [unclassified Streptomyces]|uniref:ABC transporter substrate-binding protein n=1 Tax=unclassified Streptomyces TaxID=2593676 RepID=UPI0001C1BF8B|nr:MULTISPECIES: ABC transporter substrate-binding protein [unclassified Streptomyces]AEN08056.1 Substrate-binding region of ABC-type glycine betaine transport system [Streptomyces sp. SirexAA-E]MYR68438.1 ABC transporter substrate-binding protein [Streptomyces sp. SID4939]MYS04654.1 ABC transporter substrate-binding protein [Streptomyces sp. SID4940]MYT66793.1 ABC transporter substrate-binding protein [Streptomyces sp. SID8357]MYT83714.1 ABC transporter substrate-binding protein [Streptomyces